MNMRLKNIALLFLLLTTHALAGTIKVPEINGIIHDYNNFGTNFNLKLKIRCRARKFTLGPPSTSCGDQVLNAKVSKIDDKMIYRFEKTKFNYKVGTFHVFDSIKMYLYINDENFPSYDNGSIIILNQFIKDKNVDWPLLQKHINDVSLYAFTSSVIELRMENGDSAIPYLKGLYNLTDTLLIGMRYQLLEPRVEGNLYDYYSYSLHKEGNYYANWSIDDDIKLSSKIWIFPGVINSIKLKFTSLVIREVNGSYPTPNFYLRNIEREFVYPSSSPGPIYPEYLQKITVDESWEQ